MKTAQQIYARLTEMEKIDLRMASPDRVHYLAHTIYQIECNRDVAVMKEVKQKCDHVITNYDATMDSHGPFIKATWRF